MPDDWVTDLPEPAADRQAISEEVDRERAVWFTRLILSGMAGLFGLALLVGIWSIARENAWVPVEARIEAVEVVAWETEGDHPRDQFAPEVTLTVPFAGEEFPAALRLEGSSRRDVARRRAGELAVGDTLEIFVEPSDPHRVHRERSSWSDTAWVLGVFGGLIVAVMWLQRRVSNREDSQTRSGTAPATRVPRDRHEPSDDAIQPTVDAGGAIATDDPARRSRARWRSWLVLGVLMTLFVGSLNVIVLPHWRSALWPQAAVESLGGTVVEESYTRDGVETTRYAVSLSYEFRAVGQLRTGTRWHAVGNPSFATPGDAEAAIAALKADLPVVAYDPDDPTQSELDPWPISRIIGFNVKAIGLIVAGSVLIAVLSLVGRAVVQRFS